jgi:hypothetical protein
MTIFTQTPSNEPADTGLVADVIGQSVVPTDSGPPANAEWATSPDPQPGDTYAGSGPHGLPLNGDGWRHHISHKRYIAPAVDHNALNELERCATTWTRPGPS